MSVKFFYGENQYLLREALEMEKKKFLQVHGDLNLNVFDNKEAGENTIISACETPPFLGTKKFVLVQNLDTKRLGEAFNKLLTSLPDWCELIIETDKLDARTTLAKTLKRLGALQEFAALSPGEFRQWLEQTTEKKQIKLTTGALGLLTTYTMGDCASANNELDKLAIYKNGEPITEIDIKNLVHLDLHTSVFRLTDALGARKAEHALESLQDLVSRGENLVQIFFMIVRQFRILLTLQAALKEKIPTGTLARELKLHPFVVQNSLQQLRNFSSEDLKKIYQRLLNIDTAIKTGQISYSTNNPTEFVLELEKFIVSFS